jgi:hypothetical protein
MLAGVARTVSSGPTMTGAVMVGPIGAVVATGESADDLDAAAGLTKGPLDEVGVPRVSRTNLGHLLAASLIDRAERGIPGRIGVLRPGGAAIGLPRCGGGGFGPGGAQLLVCRVQILDPVQPRGGPVLQLGGFASPARTKYRRICAQQYRFTRPSAFLPAEVYTE